MADKVAMILRPFLFRSAFAWCLTAALASTCAFGGATPAIQKENCAEKVAAIDNKFKVKAGNQEGNLVNADPAKLCSGNSNAALDQMIAGPGGQLQVRKAENFNEASTCRSAYVRLQSAVNEYKSAVQSACEKTNALADGCPTGTEDPNESFKCNARNARAAEASQKEVVAALTKARTTAGEVQAEVAAVRAKYLEDLAQIKKAEAQMTADLNAARARGNAEEIAELENLQKNATVVKDGKFVAGGGLMAALQPRGGKNPGETSSNNGGQPDISRYKYALIDPFNPQENGVLIREQTWAKATAESFKAVASSEITSRSESASRLSEYAALNEKRTNTKTDTTSTNSKVTGTAGKSELPDPKSLAALSTAATGLAGATKAASPGTNMGSLSPTPNSFNPVAAPGDPSGASRDPAGARFGDNSSPGRPTTPGDPKVVDPNAVDIAPNGRVNANVGTIAGRAGENFISSAVDVPTAGRSASSSTAKGKASGGQGDGIKSDRKLAAAGDGKPCEVKDGDCAGMNELKTPQFNAAGSLGVPTIGASDPALSTLGALDNLFGPLPALDAGGKPLVPMLGGGSVPGMMEPWGVPGEPADSPAGAKGSLTNEIAAANSRTLFSRVHGVHERAQRKGAVSLVHRKL